MSERPANPARASLLPLRTALPSRPLAHAPVRQRARRGPHRSQRFPTARSSGCSAPTARARPRSSRCSRRCCRRHPARRRSAASTSSRRPAQVRGRIGYVPQRLSADGALTGYENLRLSAKLYGLPRGETRGRHRRGARVHGPDRFGAARSCSTYSGGMIRRLEVAQAMLHRPAILFLDEPTLGLDPVARRAVRDRLQDLRRDYGMTVLITTHDMEEAEVALRRAGHPARGPRRRGRASRPTCARRSATTRAWMTCSRGTRAAGSARAAISRNAVETRRTARRLG